MASRNKRVMKEIQDCQRESASSQINIQMVGEDITNLRGQFPGPPNSPYEGGTFDVAITVPMRYPFEPLKMKFITKVYHPNVSSQSGAICLDILKDAWSPVLTLKTTLVAKVYLSDRAAYERTARNWTQMYASGGPKPSSSTGSDQPPITSSTPQSTTPSALKLFSGMPQGSASSKPSAAGMEMLALSSDAEEQILTFGLDRAMVRRFQSMGFSPDLVIKVLIDLKYQPPYINDDNLLIPDDEVLEALLLTQ
ncbi:uncharacterized protein VP01_1146g4 [Puccinia sorghi]|uniref:UBC core domain-containing protein n=1 Tax=Puccinia sorghi TaxID=27349 RepID=A0A0L6VRT1_9BASI|nr:uncharacterized protein VP01_1146g4 [Puccinia sorghi]